MSALSPWHDRCFMNIRFFFFSFLIWDYRTLLFEKSPDFNYQYHCSQLCGLGWELRWELQSDLAPAHQPCKAGTASQMWNFNFPSLRSGKLFLPRGIVWVENKLCKTPGPVQRGHRARGCVCVSCQRDCCQPLSLEDILLNSILESLLL